MKNLGLAGKNILLTGADGFLGSNIRAALKEEGAQIFSVDLKDSETSKGLDISDTNKVIEYRKYLESSGVLLDGLINNAAISPKGAEVFSEQFSRTLDVNVKGTHNCINYFKPLYHTGTSVVNVSSIYGIVSPDFSIYAGNDELFSSPCYGASKAAINQMTRYYSVQLAPVVRVNSITPGGIFQGHRDTFSERYSSRVPLKRMAEVEEIVNGILFLLSNLSSYITGQNLIIDGGLTAL